MKGFRNAQLAGCHDIFFLTPNHDGQLKCSLHHFQLTHIFLYIDWKIKKTEFNGCSDAPLYVTCLSLHFFSSTLHHFRSFLPIFQPRMPTTNERSVHLYIFFRQTRRLVLLY